MYDDENDDDGRWLRGGLCWAEFVYIKRVSLGGGRRKGEGEG